MFKDKIPNSFLAFCSLALLILASTVFSQRATPRVPTDTELEEQLAYLMKTSPGQKRRSLTQNPILAKVARERAYDMARRGYFDHVNPDGFGANYLLIQAGYSLGKGYSKGKSANSVESIACGGQNAADPWGDWMLSSGHRTHVLGLKGFYAEQTDYGIGHAYLAGSPYGHYWVVITAKPDTVGKTQAKGE